MDSTQPNEVEISLDDAGLELESVDIDSAGPPLAFSVTGVIRNVDADVMDDLRGAELEPIAVRFRVHGE